MDTLDDFLLHKEDIAFKISKLGGILGRLGLDARSETLHTLETLCQQASFRILLVGEFKRGKSCLVNAMLGDSVLPMKIAPCTTSISEVSYGELPKLYIEDNSGTHEENYTERFQYCTIQGQRSLTKDKLPIHKVQIQYPTTVCKRGITLIDSPGLNEDWSRTQTSLKEIAQADVILLILSCEMALSQSEQEFIQSHLLPYKDHLFFVWNRADAIWDKPQEEQALEQRSRDHLHQYSQNIHFVSAREGLLGKIQHNDQQWTRSQVPNLLQSIENFAVHNQAKTKLESVCQQSLQVAGYTLFQVLPRMEHFLAQPHSDLQRLQKNIEALDTTEQEAIKTLQNEIEKTTLAIVSQLDSLWTTFVDAIPTHLAKDITTLRFEPRLSRQEREDIIIHWFNQWLQTALHDFTQQQIRSSMSQEIAQLKIGLDSIRLNHIQEVEKAIERDSDEIHLFTGRWVEETSLLISTALSLLLLKIDKNRIGQDLLKVRALRGWLMGSTLSEGDTIKLASQLQLTLRQEQSTIIDSQRQHLTDTMKKLESTLVEELVLTRKDVTQQIDSILKRQDNTKQDTSLEQQLQLETIRLSVHNLHTQLRHLLNNL